MNPLNLSSSGFISRVVVCLGLGVGATTPMLGAKNITLNKAKPVTTTNTTVTTTQPVASGNDASLKALQDLNATMRENNEQNKQIIIQLENMNKKSGLGG